MTQASGATWRFRHGRTGPMLARVPEQARAEVFRYDPAGNRHEGGPEAPTREYGPGNRLVRKGNMQYRWNPEGRLAEKSVEAPATGTRRDWMYTWNLAGLLESVTTPEAERMSFGTTPSAGAWRSAWARRQRRSCTPSSRTR
ncbi:hypothetical protein [Sorangium cellulosum]|uniref:hypothetical protein n=1 Tax=Sorangium cellulosum TaxID=56 RepID=UPI0013EB1433|nr:hypothetical protein [Sorangium cellulosum]